MEMFMAVGFATENSFLCLASLQECYPYKVRFA
ncbi:hypothetical protein LINPERHAP1_LOCUS21502 [Linum perenne]